MHLCVLFVSSFWKITPQLGTACDNGGLLAVIPISAVEKLKPPSQESFLGVAFDIVPRSKKITRWWLWGPYGWPYTWATGVINTLIGDGFNFFCIHPENQGRWTHFDEHIFQRGWFNHQLDKHLEPHLETGPFCEIHVPKASKAGWFALRKIVLKDHGFSPACLVVMLL